MRLIGSTLIVVIFIGGLAAITEADFGQAVVDEAIDLFAQVGDEDDEPRTMEGLLHWAICTWPAHQECCKQSSRPRGRPHRTRFTERCGVTAPQLTATHRS